MSVCLNVIGTGVGRYKKIIISEPCPLQSDYNKSGNGCKNTIGRLFLFFFPVERPKAVRVTSSPLKRTGSLEAIYLKGQWPSPEFLSTATFKVDACTQVPSVHHFKTYNKGKFSCFYVFFLKSLLFDILFARPIHKH